MERLDVQAVLRPLKRFQRLFTAPDSTARFLVADEVELLTLLENTDLSTEALSGWSIELAPPKSRERPT